MPGLFIQAGSPIRRSPAKLARQLTEAYRSHATSFFGFQCLGIHRAPFVALTTTPLSTQHFVSLARVFDPSGHQLYSLVNVRSGNPPDLPAARSACGRRVRGLPLRRVAGGAGGTRTPDFRLAKAALSQLSYGPTSELRLVGDGGLEPPTSVLSGPRSNQLS